MSDKFLECFVIHHESSFWHQCNKSYLENKFQIAVLEFEDEHRPLSKIQNQQ
jgi:hypothetical protein